MANLVKQFEKMIESLSLKVEEAVNPSKIIGQLTEVDEAAAKMYKSFGVGRDNIQSINAGLTQAVTNVTLLGGSFKDVADIQLSIAKDLGRNVILTSESVEKLYSTYKVTNVEVGTLATNFKDIGFSSGKISEQMSKVVNSAREIGVNGQAVSKQAVENLSAMNKFNFQGGVEGLAKMAAQAVNLRVDMKSTLALADRMFDPEQAINMAAAMQRLGVAQGDLLDPLRMMDLAQNDPAELQNQIAQMSKQFVQLGKDGQFEIMPGGKRQMMEIAKELQIPYETLTKMALAGSELDVKMQKIKFPTDAFSEKDEKFIANMAEMDSQGNYTLKVDGKDMGIDEAMKKFANDKDSLTKFMKDSKPKSVEELAKDQLSVLQSINGQMDSIATIGYALAGSKTGKDLLQVGKEGVKAAATTVRSANPLGSNTKQQSETIDLVFNGLSGLADVLTGEESLTDVLSKLGTIGTTIETQINTNLRTAADQASNSLGNLAKSGNQFYEIAKKFFDKGASTSVQSSNLSVQKVGDGDVKPKEGENKVIETKNTVINPPPENKTVSDGGVELNSSKNVTPTKTSNSEDITITITHDIKGTPPNIDVAQLAQMMTNSDITQTIIREIKRTSTNNGLNEPYRPQESFGYA